MLEITKAIEELEALCEDATAKISQLQRVGLLNQIKDNAYGPRMNVLRAVFLDLHKIGTVVKALSELVVHIQEKDEKIEEQAKEIKRLRTENKDLQKTIQTNSKRLWDFSSNPIFED